jgi:hypothetical protein
VDISTLAGDTEYAKVIFDRPKEAVDKNATDIG